MRRWALVLLALLILFLGPGRDLQAGRPWGASLFYGQLTETHFEEILVTPPRVEERYLLAGALRREIGAVRKVVGWAPQGLYLDAEGGLVHKWGNWQQPDHGFQEAFLSANLRYDPGSNMLGISGISFGNGLSYTRRKPEYEKDITLNDRTARLLYYMMMETAFHLPGTRNWELLFRVHHRSGGYGTFQGVQGGSNYLCLGLRYRFFWF